MNLRAYQVHVLSAQLWFILKYMSQSNELVPNPNTKCLSLWRKQLPCDKWW